jgi:hypothetical protein
VPINPLLLIAFQERVADLAADERTVLLAALNLPPVATDAVIVQVLADLTLERDVLQKVGVPFITSDLRTRGIGRPIRPGA